MAKGFPFRRLPTLRPGMATRVMGSEVWKLDAAVTADGVVVSWLIHTIQRPRRVQLGLAMGCVKGDDARIDWDWTALRDAKA